MKGILKGIGFFLLYAVFTVVFQFLSVSVFMGIAAAQGCRDEKVLNEIANSNILGASVISGILTVLAFFIIFKLRKSDIKTEWKLGGTTPKLLLLSAAVSFSFSLLYALLTYDGSIENSLMIQTSAEYYSNKLPGLGIFMMIINLIVIAPIAEETALRGIVFTRIEKGTSSVIAVVVSSLLFGLMHLSAGGILLAAGAFAMGAVFSIVFYRTNSLPACFIAHACANLPDFIFYDHPAMSNGLMLALEIVSGAVFVLGTFFLLKSDRSDNK